MAEHLDKPIFKAGATSEVEPTVPTDLTTKNYVDNRPTSGMDQATADARYVNIDGDTMTNTLKVIIPGSGGTGLNLDTITPGGRDIVWSTNAVARWVARVNSSAETGSHAGSDFEFIARNDDGSVRYQVWSATRATGDMRVLQKLDVDGFTTAAESFYSGWSGTVTIFRRAGWVMVKMVNVKKTSAVTAAGQGIFTIPSGFRMHASAGNCYVALAANSGIGSGGVDGLKTYMCVFNTDGTVETAGSYFPAANVNLSGTITYPVA